MNLRITIEQYLAPLTLKFIDPTRLKNGYKILCEDGTLKKIHDLKIDISKEKLLKINSKIDYNITKHLSVKDVEFYKSQLIYTRLFSGYWLINSISLAKISNKAILYPLEKNLQNKFSEEGFQINFFMSTAMWYMFKILLIINDFFKTLFFIFNFKSSEKEIYPTSSGKRKKIYIPGAQKYHLPNSHAQEKQDNFSNWLSESIYFDEKLLILHPCNEITNSYNDISNLHTFFISKFPFIKTNLRLKIKAFICLVKKILFSKKDYFLLLSNFSKIYLILCEEYNPQVFQADVIIFDYTQGIIKPLWAIVAEKNGSEVVFCFYAVAADPQFSDGTGFRNGLWALSTWKDFWLNNNKQRIMLSEFITTNDVNYRVVGVPYWIDSGILITQPAKSFIAVFDTEPHVSSYYLSNLQAIEMYTQNSIEFFFETILESATNLGFLVVHKYKKEIHNHRTDYYKKILTNLEIKYPDTYIRVDATIAPSRIIIKSAATIVMPISTPAVISRDLGVPTIYFDPTAKISKSDPALMEIKLINSKADLNQWLVYVTTKQMEN